MGIIAKKESIVPTGTHNGKIVDCRTKEVVFDPEKGEETVVEVTIQPAFKTADGSPVLPLSTIFTPNLNGLSGLSKTLNRLGLHPKEGEEWEPSHLIGTPVSFTVETGRNGFQRIVKDSIRPPTK